VGRSRFRYLPLLAVLALALTACGNGGGDSGRQVEIFGAFTAEEADQFRRALEPFEQETGIEVRYEGSRDFEALITTRAEGGDAPDVAIFPQPGLLQDLVDSGDIRALDGVVDLAALRESLIPGFLDAATFDDKVYGVPIRMAVKSVLWYPVPEFEQAGYEVPTTYAELQQLQRRMLADGRTPWCIGAESGAATGWVLTDWVEEFMLRTAGPDAYDAWVEHRLEFDSPEVKRAASRFGAIFSTDGIVLGGPRAILSTPFGDAPDPMFAETPRCWLHRQGNFITGFFPQEVQEDLDGNVGAAYFPPIAEGGYDGKPVLAGGDLAALLADDNPDAERLMQFLADSDFGGPWAQAGGWLSPHKGFDTSLYPNEVTRQLYQIGAEADVLRYDASDLMPGAVGTGSFWDEMVQWVSGDQSLDQALEDIDQSWPQDQ
jgi:alpha-glucoside transport system substrate-binding protein